MSNLITPMRLRQLLPRLFLLPYAVLMVVFGGVASLPHCNGDSCHKWTEISTGTPNDPAHVAAPEPGEHVPARPCLACQVAGAAFAFRIANAFALDLDGSDQFTTPVSAILESWRRWQVPPLRAPPLGSSQE